MTINEVLENERKELNFRIQELETDVKDWIKGIMSDVQSDRDSFPDDVTQSFAADFADNVLQQFEDFEFEQLDVLKELSDKLQKLSELQWNKANLTY